MRLARMMSFRIRTVRASFLGLPRFPWAQSFTLHKFSELSERKYKVLE